jgi:hypothetical protein
MMNPCEKRSFIGSSFFFVFRTDVVLLICSATSRLQPTTSGQLREERQRGREPAVGGVACPCQSQRRRPIPRSHRHPPSCPCGGPGQCGESGAWTHPGPPHSPAPQPRTYQPSQRRRERSFSSARTGQGRGPEDELGPDQRGTIHQPPRACRWPERSARVAGAALRWWWRRLVQ